jgi:hypothetical protein
MGCINTKLIFEVDIHGDGIKELTETQVKLYPFGSSDPSIKTYTFIWDLKDQCYGMLTELKNTRGYVNVGVHKSVIYYISDINKPNILTKSRFISPTCYNKCYVVDDDW